MLLSVVVAVKNEQIHVEEALLSILGQKGVNFELIVVDDGSNDNTFEILQSLQKQYDFYLTKNPKAGKPSAFNLGISLAKGDYVCMFAGDDVMPEGSLEKRIDSISHCNDEPTVGLSKLQILSENKKLNGAVIPNKPGVGGFTGSSYMMNRKAVELIFPIPESLPNEDTWMEVAIRYLSDQKWNLVHTDIISNNWRVHSGNSISHQMDFDTYNEKFSSRYKAHELFYDSRFDEMSVSARTELKKRVECESFRLNKQFFRILFSQVTLVEKLRAVSNYNNFFYTLRSRFFLLFSGW
ncbi:glycosyltransferase family 2 protein [Pseudoalteromonas sp. S16_S37]|uniref:glycosyltransferase family 2 protein n=1 Tax=Pseudoalteromonas sp. S16_S37 TaxID=2720228 RepID=UPI001681C138|nr:glycosyltransferase [Pseudoalteromonas sp. S16_S37]MBD1580939.1 glycosyltransferase [Pseudoalteromonas sp. S16_S37]